MEETCVKCGKTIEWSLSILTHGRVCDDCKPAEGQFYVTGRDRNTAHDTVELVKMTPYDVEPEYTGEHADYYKSIGYGLISKGRMWDFGSKMSEYLVRSIITGRIYWIDPLQLM